MRGWSRGVGVSRAPVRWGGGGGAGGGGRRQCTRPWGILSLYIVMRCPRPGHGAACFSRLHVSFSQDTRDARSPRRCARGETPVGWVGGKGSPALDPVGRRRTGGGRQRNKGGRSVVAAASPPSPPPPPLVETMRTPAECRGQTAAPATATPGILHAGRRAPLPQPSAAWRAAARAAGAAVAARAVAALGSARPVRGCRVPAPPPWSGAPGTRGVRRAVSRRGGDTCGIVGKGGRHPRGGTAGVETGTVRRRVRGASHGHRCCTAAAASDGPHAHAQSPK